MSSVKVNDNHMNWEWELKFPILSDCPEIAMPLGFLKYGADNYLFFEDGGKSSFASQPYFRRMF